MGDWRDRDRREETEKEKRRVALQLVLILWMKNFHDQRTDHFELCRGPQNLSRQCSPHSFGPARTMSRESSSKLAFTLLFVALFFTLTQAAPSPPNLVYSLQEQRPPVARVNQTWSWTLLPDTFNASSGATLTLSSRSLPSWATFDAASYTFAGLPGAADVGSQYVTVQANVSGVATGTTDGFQLLVVDGQAAYVRLSIAEQLPSASSLGGGATYTADGAMRVPPNWSFSLGFQQYTFQDASLSQIYYTAYQTGTTELPSWLSFDNRTVTFDGLAPSTLGEMSFTIFGSDHFGYGDVQQQFSLSVGYHYLSLGQPLPSLNTSIDDAVNYTIPISGILLDNSTIVASNLSAVEVTLTNLPYLSYDSKTRVISGSIPSTVISTSFSIPVTFRDVYNDTVVTNISMAILTSLFTSSTLPALVVQPGQNFSDDLSPYFTNHRANYSVSTLPSSAEKWINFDATTHLLYGTAPTTSPGNITLSFTGVDSNTGISSEAALVLAVSKAAATSSSAPLPTSSVTPVTSHHGLSHSAKLGIGIAFGTLGGILLLVCLLACCRQYLSNDRRIRRDASTLIFDQATIAAAQKSGRSTGETTFISRFRKSPKSEGEKTPTPTPSPIIRPGLPPLAPEVVSFAPSGPVENDTSSAKPKRLNLMGIFKGSTPKRDISTISLPMSQNSLFGLGIGDSPSRHNIVVVTDGTGATFVPGNNHSRSDDDERAGTPGESDIERTSSWGSGGSSSLFYSDGSDHEAGGSGRPKRPNGGERSAPKQRRDFLPIPIRAGSQSPTPSPARSNSPYDSNSSFASSSGQGGIRLVTSPPHNTSQNNFNYNSSSPTRDADESYLASTGSGHSIGPGGPRLIPFTNERNFSQTAADSRRRVSAMAHPHRNSAIEDADEIPNRRSALYAPPLQGSPTTSAVFFSNARDDEWNRVSAISASDYGAAPEGIRLVSSRPGSPDRWTHRRTATSSMYIERIRVHVNEPFRFTPQMNPAPSVAISSSPGRGGPPRASYMALMDTPENPSTDRQPLPDWLHFDQGSLEIWGLPRRVDVGSMALLIIERKVAQVPGSPTRRGSPDSRSVPEELEQVVGRYVLDVEWRRESSRPLGDSDDEGVLQVIQY